MEIFIGIAVLLLLVAAPVVVVNRDLLLSRPARRHASDVPLPFLIIPSFPGAADIVPAGFTGRRGAPRAWAPPARSQPQPPREPVDRAAEPAAGPATPAAQPAPAQPTPPAQPARPSSFAPAPLADAAPQPVERQVGLDHWSEWFEQSFDIPSDDPELDEVSPDATVVFSRPVDEPVQILPGRLQVLSGDGAGRDLRLFSRIGEPPRIVVGRETGPAHQHITLSSPTVSRRHALMDFDNGQWTITNLSETNPVLVNDRVLSNGGSARKLADGDRIELGEVALRFLAG
jgi:hypothetical protein